ncbi:MAG TPA: universal stress protein [Nitrososphaeraceae archaeon]
MDGSRNSYKAVSAALSLSKSVDSKVTVIHVTEYLPKPHFLSQKALEQLLQEQSNKGRKYSTSVCFWRKKSEPPSRPNCKKAILPL